MVLLVAMATCFSSFAQRWQQKVDYLIDVTLDDSAKTLDGFEKLTYYNHSPDTLTYIWFHLWPNAYKNDRTAFSDQLLKNGNTRFYFSSPQQRGYINRLEFRVNGKIARLEDHPEHIDIAKLVLPQALPPGGQITITTPFHVKLPFNFSRGGYAGKTFQLTQWYPKPAVYDHKGWHPMPYLDQGEFFSEFGDYDVRISLPAEYIVAATGNRVPPPQDSTRNYEATQPVVISESAAGHQTHRYLQANIHDFAIFADKTFTVKSDTCVLSSGKVILVESFYKDSEKTAWKGSVDFAKRAIRFYSGEAGEYPYDVVRVVEGPESFGGGMEYPTITVIAPTAAEKELDITIAHEIGHNWFYGVLASHERQHPWLDEGLNTFYQYKYEKAFYGNRSGMEDLALRSKIFLRKDQPIETPAELFSSANYGLVAYHKTALWLESMESAFGKDQFRSAMQHYYQTWSFRHPYPEDFSAIMIDHMPGAATFFESLKRTGALPGIALQGTMLVSPFKKGSIKNFIQNPVQNTLFVSPVIGGNYYDGLMIGSVITNYKLPPNKFRFLAAPMFAIRSKNLTGIGRLNYSLPSLGAVRKTEFFINGSRFSMDSFRDTAGKKYTMQFSKLVPGIKMTLREKDARSTRTRSLQWKTFLVGEEGMTFTPDTVFNAGDTALVTNYGMDNRNYYVNRFSFSISDHRALYPFNVLLQADQGQDFIRPSLTADYFFNYAKGGGLKVRFFGGKFFYLDGKTGSQQFSTDRYHLNMTGANGYEDYTYSNYFYGRNEFDGLASQQIMIRDGGFKVRTDLLSQKIGKTDDWLMALNFNSTIPDKWNPLSRLPVKIPLRIFADIGTYGDVWKRNAEGDRFLFDAGLHIPLLGERVNIYMPLFYNAVYRDYIKSTIPKNRFLKTISFTVDLYSKDVQTLNREVEW
jgi:hypothetical protein